MTWNDNLCLTLVQLLEFFADLTAHPAVVQNRKTAPHSRTPNLLLRLDSEHVWSVFRLKAHQVHGFQKVRVGKYILSLLVRLRLLE